VRTGVSPNNAVDRPGVMVAISRERLVPASHGERWVAWEVNRLRQ